MDQIKVRQLVQVEDSGGEACDQQVSGFVEGSSCQAVKISLFIEKVSETAETGYQQRTDQSAIVTDETVEDQLTVRGTTKHRQDPTDKLEKHIKHTEARCSGCGVPQDPILGPLTFTFQTMM